MSHGEICVWLADGAKAFKVLNIDKYRQALKEYDKNPDSFDDFDRRNAAELREKL